MELVKAFRECNDGNGFKDMVNNVGVSSSGEPATPVIAAVAGEHFGMVQWLIEECHVDLSITDTDGMNALHVAACRNKKNIELIDLLLTHMGTSTKQILVPVKRYTAPIRYF